MILLFEGGIIMAVIEITAANFQKEVLESDKPVLIDFWASWCGPCRMMGPVVEEIAQEHEEIKVGKVNVDVEQQLAMQFQIDAIPALLVFKNGQKAAATVGLQPKENILALL